MLKIEKGVPKPPQGRPGKYAEAIETFVAMSPGDSFLFPCTQAQSQNTRQALYTAICRKLGAGLVSVHIVSGGVRVWRIK